MITDIISSITVYLYAQFKRMEQQLQIMQLLQKGTTMTPKVPMWLAGTILDYNCQLWYCTPDWMMESDCLLAQSHLLQLQSTSSNIRQQVNREMCPHVSIRRVFLEVEWRWFLFAAVIPRIQGTSGAWTVWVLEGDQRVWHGFTIPHEI
jgi:hypothetical protein